MKDEDKTKEQLVNELVELRQRVAELETSETECKRVEKALRASEKRYRELFENANDGVYTHDLAGNFTSFNRTAELVSGYSRDEALKMNIAEIVAPEHLELARQMIARKVAEGASTTYELEIVTKDGRRVPLEVSTRITYEEGKPVGVQGIARDITERKRAEEELKKHRDHLEELVAERTAELTRANEQLRREIAERKRTEEALRESEQKFRSIVEQSVDGIILVNEQGFVNEWNRGQEQISGLKRAEAIGRPVWDVMFRVIPDEERSQGRYEWFKASMNQFLMTGQAPWLNQLQEGNFLRADGVLRTFQQLIFPIETDKGFMAGNIIRDITERKQKEAEIKILRGLLPICASCKKIRDDRGYWNHLEVYIRDHSEADFTHGICPDCGKKLYGPFWKESDE
jgi:PAS domain S-box-containing protein